MSSVTIEEKNKRTIFRKPSFKKEWKENSELYLMISPAVAFFLLFAYVPMLGLVIAFKNYNFIDGILKSPWCGLDNFKFFFQSGKALIITSNTFYYNIAFLLVNTVAEVILAIIIAEISGKYIKKVCQTIMLLPNFISWVVVGVFLYNVFNFEYGILNSFLKTIGMQPIQVYSTEGAWKYILVAVNCWKSAGYGSIIYLAAVMGIDRDCYEAAEIDGATIWKKIKYITLPLLTPTIVTMTLLSLGRILRGNFEMFYQLIGQNGMLYNATDIIDTYVFRALLSNTELGMSSAAGFYQSVLCFATILLANWAIKKYDSEYALF